MAPAPRDVHEGVLPPIPLSPAAAGLAAAPLVHGAAQQQHWLATIARMRAQPGADQHELSEIESHITHGVTLPLVSAPSSVAYANTPTVLQHADAVRKRRPWTFGNTFRKLTMCMNVISSSPCCAEHVCKVSARSQSVCPKATVPSHRSSTPYMTVSTH